jgi:hypothetical protein
LIPIPVPPPYLLYFFFSFQRRSLFSHSDRPDFPPAIPAMDAPMTGLALGDVSLGQSMTSFH